jgi:hypothetical protein
MTDDPVLHLAATIEEKERATLGLDPVTSAKIEAELGTLDRYFDLTIPTSAEGAAIKLQKSADFVGNELQDEECTEAAEVLLRQMAERANRNQLQPIDLASLRFVAAVLRKLDENSATANLIGSTLQWPKLV